MDIINGLDNANHLELAGRQVKAVLRNRKSLENFSEITTRLTVILIALATIQILAVIFQFVFMMSELARPWIGLISLVLFGACSIYILKTFLINHKK